MNKVEFTWNEEANGWVTPLFELTGNIYLIVTLKEKGMFVVKKSNTKDGPKPKIFISRKGGTDYECKLYGDSEGKFIQIVTSTEPIEIKYANI